MLNQFLDALWEILPTAFRCHIWWALLWLRVLGFATLLVVAWPYSIIYLVALLCGNLYKMRAQPYTRSSPDANTASWEQLFSLYSQSSESGGHELNSLIGKPAQHFVVTRDGVRLRYMTLGSGKRAVMLANGMGASYYSGWMPILAIGKHATTPTGKPGVDFEKFTYVMFDYRGQFKSSPPSAPDEMTPDHHAEDIACILDDLGIETLDMLMGWSFGVQVALAFALKFPSRVQKLALICGSPGQTLSKVGCLLGPLRPLNGIIRFVLVSVLEGAQNILYGPRYGKVWAVQYLLDMVSYGESHTRHWLQMAYCLEDHDASQQLHRINQPTLLMTGHLDALTPSFGMFGMHRSLPNSRLIVRPYGGHFLLWEYPQWTALNLVDFFFNPPPCDKKHRPSAGRMPVRKESDYAVDEND